MTSDTRREWTQALEPEQHLCSVRRLWPWSELEVDTVSSGFPGPWPIALLCLRPWPMGCC